jgi:hypothetical protein
MGRIGLGEIVVLAIVLFLIVKVFRKFFRNNSKAEEVEPTSIEKEKMEDVIVNIPDKCPHCKNPNTKKIRLCEWCGNQII